MNYSPLRYPGGKQRLAGFIVKLCVKNNFTGHYIEPYAGGAAVALTLLLDGYVSKITINDKDRSIYAFWFSVLNHTDALCAMISKKRVSQAEWKRQKNIQRRKSRANILKLGFSTLFLNRTNVSGILNGGIIGGKSQDGEYLMDCRFNKKELIKRIKLIAQYKENIEVLNMDAVDLIKKYESKNYTKQRLIFCDPPYFVKGESLYLNAYSADDHSIVSRTINKIKKHHWVVSYDNTLPIRKLYSKRRAKQYTLRHLAAKSKTGKEIVFLSDELLIPKSIFD